MESLRSAHPQRLAVGIATRGRAGVLARTIAELQHQRRRPDRVIVCYTEPADIEGLDDSTGVELRLDLPGCCRQRNTIIRTADDCDIVVFFDDDFLPASDYLAQIADTMARHPDIVAITGVVIADGINGPGLSVDAGLQLLADDHYTLPATAITPIHNVYGCNMAFRLGTVREHQISFDPNLPLYAWLEDLDFSRRLGRFGRVVRLLSARGVHLGVKSGRSSGRRLGYSQVANPLYIVRKGEFALSGALTGIARNLVANIVRLPWPEPYVDRRGRLSGNLLAITDLIRGRIDPRRILEL